MKLALTQVGTLIGETNSRELPPESGGKFVSWSSRQGIRSKKLSTLKRQRIPSHLDTLVQIVPLHLTCSSEMLFLRRLHYLQKTLFSFSFFSFFFLSSSVRTKKKTKTRVPFSLTRQTSHFGWHSVIRLERFRHANITASRRGQPWNGR